MTRQEQKAAAFRALHAAQPFVIPNPWNAGSARILEALGFRALATTSSGFAFTLGRRDGEATLDQVVEHTAALIAPPCFRSPSISRTATAQRLTTSRRQ